MNGLVDLDKLGQELARNGLNDWHLPLTNACVESSANRHGKLAEWKRLIDTLQHFRLSSVELESCIRLETDVISTSQTNALKQQLLKLSPWRKGPFDVFGVNIDSEWRSDWKWQRIASHINLEDKTVLDVGCGNGYYMLRMLGAGAGFILGIDPVVIYNMQFKAINYYLKSQQLQLLPLTLEEMPEMAVFDTIFSMGVLYHRRAPNVHLADLRSMLKPGGELVLETLVIESLIEQTLTPEQRYAGMKNVWCIPSVPRLMIWCEQAGFKNMELLDCSPTTLVEQRQTEWMTTYSLKQFLDPEDLGLTIEGYPAPVRAVIKCSG